MVHRYKSRVVRDAGRAVQYLPSKIFHDGVQRAASFLCESLLRVPSTDVCLMFLILPRSADGAHLVQLSTVTSCDIYSISADKGFVQKSASRINEHDV